MKPPITINNKVVVKPFPDNSVKTESTGTGPYRAVRMVNSKTDLVGLKVVYRALIQVNGKVIADIGPGATGYIRASEYAQPWAKDVFEFNGESFILVPYERFEFFEAAPE